MTKTIKLVLVFTALTFGLAGCGDDDEDTTTTTAAATATTAAGGSSTSAPGGPTTESGTNFTITTRSPGRFTPDNINTTAGSQIRVSFSVPAASQAPHSWVVVRKGSEDSVVAAAADMETNLGSLQGVIAATNVLSGGQSQQITFTAPAAGSYTILCSVQGHYANGMKGEFTVS